MASINSLISQFANTFKEPNNHTLRAALRDIIIQVRSEIIRHSYEQHGYVDKVLTQRFTLDLEEMLDGEISLEGIEFFETPMIKRTKIRIPRPVRLTNNLPFDRVSTAGFSTNIEFPYIKETSARFRKSVPGLRRMDCYDYINGYVYIFPSKNIVDLVDCITIEAAFENPNLIDIENNFTNEEAVDFNENEFLLSDDMIGQIKDIIYKRDLLAQVRETNETPDTIKY